MIVYVDQVEGIIADQLDGFFVGWPNPPSHETHLRLLTNSDHVVLAVDDAFSKVVGFVNAVSDHVLSAYIPLLEVLPDYQGRGIGQELMRQMLEKLKGLYMIDMICDRELELFYVRFGMKASFGMVVRNYEGQSGAQP